MMEPVKNTDKYYKKGVITMKEYKGYMIEKITRNDWMIKDQNGDLVRTPDDRPTTRTLREAKALIDIVGK